MTTTGLKSEAEHLIEIRENDLAIRNGLSAELIERRIHANDVPEPLRDAPPQLTTENAKTWFRTCLNWVQL